MASQDDSENASVPALITAIVVNGVTGLLLLLAFVLLRPHRPHLYSPRKLNYPLSSWFAVMWLPEKVLLDHVGLDAYMLLRFLRMCFYLFGALSVVGLVILMPINATGSAALHGLDQLSLGNLTSKEAGRLWAHLVCSYLFTGAVVALVLYEFRKYTELRARWLTSTATQQRPEACTVLVQDIPVELRNENSIRQIFSVLPGGVRYIWFHREVDLLPFKITDREACVNKLERVLVKYSKKCKKALPAGDASQRELCVTDLMRSSSGDVLYPHRSMGSALASDNDDMTPYIAEVPRPSHWKGIYPFYGSRVDSIDSLYSNIQDLNKTIDRMVAKVRSAPYNGVAFVTFYHQLSAHLAAQVLVHSRPFTVSPITLSPAPTDVKWSNLPIQTISRKIRGVIVWCITWALIGFWAIPVAAIQSLVNLQAASDIPGLGDLVRWILSSSVISGLVAAILPTLAVKIFFSVLPAILSALSIFEGILARSWVQLAVFKKFFLFNIINVLFVTIVAGSFYSRAQQFVESPASVIPIIATALPAVSSFFINYIVLNSFVGSAMELLSFFPLFYNWLSLTFFAITPREIEAAKAPRTINYGGVWPNHLLIFVITITYSVQAPLILPFATIYYGLYLVAHQHNLVFVYENPFEMGGLFFPLVVNRVFIGLYLMQICLFGLFLASTNWTSGALMLVLIAATAFSQHLAVEALNPMVEYLALTDASVAMEPSLDLSDNTFLHPSMHASCPEVCLTEEEYERSKQKTAPMPSFLDIDHELDVDPEKRHSKTDALEAGL